MGRCNASHWQYYVILDSGYWMFLDLTCGEFQYIQHQVSSIQHRRGKNHGLSNTRHEEIKIFMQR